MRRNIREALAERLGIQVPKEAVLLTSFEVAHFLRISRDALAHWRKNGRGPAFMRISRRTVRYPRKAFQRYLEQHLQGRISAGVEANG